MLNSMYFRRAGKVMLGDVISGVQYDNNKAVVTTLDRNLRTLGYTLHADLMQTLLAVSPNDIKAIFDEIIKEAKEIRGVRAYRPVYPNFPKQVMEARESELYWNAMIHYWSGGTLLPVYAKEERPVLDFDEKKFSVIHLGSRLDFQRLFTDLINSKSGFSATDKDDIKAVVAVSPETFYNAAGDGKQFTNRENKAFITAIVHNLGIELQPDPKDSATDILRLAVALSDGDTSLSDKTNFRNFKRSERRMLLACLDVIGNAAEDMERHAAAWKRLGEKLHPGEFAAKFPNAAKAFESVRRNGGIVTFNSRVENALARQDTVEVVRLLTQRPGDFARRLDHVLRIGRAPVEREIVLNAFQGVAPKVSPTVLIQTRNAFINRAKSQRVFFPKGSVAKMQVVEDKRANLNKAYAASVVNIIDGALATIFADRGELGNVYVDPSLKGVAVPFGLRNASKALKTLGRGSRLPLDTDTGVVRFFIWWKNAEVAGRSYSGHTDIDLSAVCLDEKFQNVFDITYYNLREKGAVHSGDITNAPAGASEFIDIDVNRLREQGVRYVAMTLYSYSGHGFVELPECFAGFMQRKDLGSGEIYDPRTVTNKVDLASDARSATPFIFDLETGEAIWVDLSVKVQGAFANAYNSREVTKTVAQAMVELTPPNLYDLFTAHATSRGRLVPKDKADTVYSLDGDVTPFDSEEILANYL